jgi:hypothetical protein
MNACELNSYTKASPSWEATSRSAGGENFRLSFNPNVHYRLKNSPLLFPVLGKKKKQQTTLHYSTRCLILSYNPRGLTIKFANSLPRGCRGSSGQKPQYGIDSQPRLLFGSTEKAVWKSYKKSSWTFCQQLMDLASWQCVCSHGTVCEGSFS